MLFLKLFSRTIARIVMLLGGGICLGGLMIGGSELLYLQTAVAVTATVQDTEVQCSLRWEGVDEYGKRKKLRSDRMDCATAQAQVELRVRPRIRLVEHHRSLLAYSAPDGRPLRKWSGISRYEGTRLQAGDRVGIMVDPEDPAQFRPVRDSRDLRVLAWMIFGGLAAGAGGWLVRRRITV